MKVEGDEMLLITLFIEFMKVGLFSVGGGLATLPFLYAMADKYPWFTRTELIDMIAISESTPGPIGVNMATFAGYQAAGIIGGIIASLAMILPALIIIMLIAKALNTFKDNKYVNAIFYGIRPAVAALILVSALDIVVQTLFDVSAWEKGLFQFLNIRSILLFVVVFGLLNKYKKHPVFYICFAAIVGIFVPL